MPVAECSLKRLLNVHLISFNSISFSACTVLQYVADRRIVSHDNNPLQAFRSNSRGILYYWTQKSLQSRFDRPVL
jgi:hypothetical protein